MIIRWSRLRGATLASENAGLSRKTSGSLMTRRKDPHANTASIDPASTETHIPPTQESRVLGLVSLTTRARTTSSQFHLSSRDAARISPPTPISHQLPVVSSFFLHLPQSCSSISFPVQMAAPSAWRESRCSARGT